jgi:phage terminase small subunit
MATPGKKPNPVGLHAIAGGKNTFGETVSSKHWSDVVSADAIIAGDDLALACFEETAAAMHEAGFLSALTKKPLQGYCMVWANLVRVRQMINERRKASTTGATGMVDVTPNNFLVQSAYVSMENKQHELLRAYASELGLTPTALARASRKATDQLALPFENADPMEGLMYGPRPVVE